MLYTLNVNFVNDSLKFFAAITEHEINYFIEKKPSLQNCKISTVEECVFTGHDVIFVLHIIKLYSPGVDF